MNKPAAIYARVSSDRQKDNHTIASQTAALKEYAQRQGYAVPAEWVFEDEGYSGANLARPGLEALRDLAAAGQIEAALAQQHRAAVGGGLGKNGPKTSRPPPRTAYRAVSASPRPC